MAPPSKYSPEFREEAVQIALRSSKTISETARDLELNPETLRGWVKKHQKQHEPSADADLTVSERARLNPDPPADLCGQLLRERGRAL
ncbi:transposase [Streptomyces sp. NBC_01217]|uniref:transposase n=1 Tax=Streptomyces sp. NBC_01217 TaxID=2903779 RepID=UPI002E10600D|nr:transposase [Streptomyces sp. NBC_01217]